MAKIPRRQVASAGAGSGGIGSLPALRANAAASAAPATALRTGAENVARFSAVAATNRRQLDELEGQAKQLADVSALELQFRATASNRTQEAALKDPLTQGTETIKIMQEEIQNLAASMQGFTAANQQYLMNRANNLAAAMIPASGKAQTQAIHKLAVQTTAENLDSIMQGAISATDPRDVEAGKKAAETIHAGLVTSGVKTSGKAQIDFREFSTKIDMERGTNLYLEDPDRFLAISLDQLRVLYPDLDPSGIETLLQGATKESDRRNTEINKAEELREENLMDRLEQAAVRKELEVGDLDTLVGINWLTRENRDKMLQFMESLGETSKASNPDVVRRLEQDILVDDDVTFRRKLLAKRKDRDLSDTDYERLLADLGPVHDLRNLPGFNDSLDRIRDTMGGGNILSNDFNQDLEAKIQNAQLELMERTRKGENHRSIWPEIVKKWQEVENLPAFIGDGRIYRNKKEVAKDIRDGIISEKRGILEYQQINRELERIRNAAGIR